MGRHIRLVLGEGATKPGPTNTGHSGTLTAYTGGSTITAPNTLVENKEITLSTIYVRAANVTFRNCLFRGNASVTAGTTLVSTDSTSCVNALFEDCTFAPDVPGIYSQGIHGGGYTARRCDVHDVVDGFGCFAPTQTSAWDQAANVLLEYNWVHDLFCWTPCPYQSDNITHNDCTQTHGGGNITIRGNTFTANPSATSHPDVGGTSCVMGTAALERGALWGVLIEDNWFDYGTACLNLNQWTTPDPYSSITVRNNKFGRHGGRESSSMGYRILADPNLNCPGMRTNTGPDTQGNVFEDTGLPVTVYRM